MLASDANLEHLANTRVLPCAHRALLELTLRRLRPVHRQHALPARRFRLLTKEAAQQKLVVATQDTQTKSDCYLSSLCPPVICDACIPGKYSKDRAASSCIVCAAGTYAAGASSGCLSCPEHSTSSSDSTTCTCSTGYISASFHIDAD